MTDPDIEKLCERLDPEAATALRSVHARAVKAEDKLWPDQIDEPDWKSRAVTAEAALADAQAAVKVLREAAGQVVDETVFNQQRFAEDDDTDYFMRCFRSVKDRLRAALAQTSRYGEGE